MRWPYNICLCIVLAGCATRPGGPGDAAEARRKLDLARRLEASTAYREAAHEYAMVADQYPATEFYPIAARKAALLYASPDSPARNDTAALRWIRAVLALEIPPEEREALEVLRKLLVALKDVRADADRVAASADSLSAASRRQGAALSAEMRRAAELEDKLQQTLEELRKLKEIDVQVSKSRRQR